MDSILILALVLLIIYVFTFTQPKRRSRKRNTPSSDMIAENLIDDGTELDYLSRIEQNINDNGFTTRRATEQDLKKMLGVYFEQNVTTEKFEDFDGDRWVIVGE